MSAPKNIRCRSTVKPPAKAAKARKTGAALAVYPRPARDVATQMGGYKL
jgi:hypothetical protein